MACHLEILGWHRIKSRAGKEVCDPSLIHADSEYLRGTIAAVHSVFKHASCPENTFFHFVASDSSAVDSHHLSRILKSTFPLINFRVYVFRESLVSHMISSSIRRALENPLNYARSYLADLLDPCVERVIYLDSDIVVVDDIQKLWEITLSGSRVIGALEYCHTNFTKYFSDEFWKDSELSKVFDRKRPWYFNTGVMVIDLDSEREEDLRTGFSSSVSVGVRRRRGGDSPYPNNLGYGFWISDDFD
ncbi:hypothetical protein ACFX15_034619 [Malus domestica]